MTRTDKIQENLDDEVHCWSQVPRAGSVTVNVSLKFLWKDKTHEKKEIASKVKVHMKTIRRLKIAEDFKSCCRVLLMPQGLVRQMYPVQSTVVFHSCYNSFGKKEGKKGIHYMYGRMGRVSGSR